MGDVVLDVCLVLLVFLEIELRPAVGEDETSQSERNKASAWHSLRHAPLRRGVSALSRVATVGRLINNQLLLVAASQCSASS